MQLPTGSVSSLGAPTPQTQVEELTWRHDSVQQLQPPYAGQPSEAQHSPGDCTVDSEHATPGGP